MNRPRFRFTTGLLMIFVAILAVACGLETLRRRRAAFDEKAAELRWAEYVEWHGERRPKVAEYYNQQARKYEQAARYPWRPVEPDPPEPK